MTELGKQIKNEINMLLESYVTSVQKKSLERVLALVDELDGNYEALRTAVLEKPAQQAQNTKVYFDVPHRVGSTVVVSRAVDEAALEQGLRYGKIE